MSLKFTWKAILTLYLSASAQAWAQFADVEVTCSSPLQMILGGFLGVYHATATGTDYRDAQRRAKDTALDKCEQKRDTFEDKENFFCSSFCSQGME